MSAVVLVGLSQMVNGIYIKKYSCIHCLFMNLTKSTLSTTPAKRSLRDVSAMATINLNANSVYVCLYGCLLFSCFFNHEIQ